MKRGDTDTKYFKKDAKHPIFSSLSLNLSVTLALRITNIFNDMFFKTQIVHSWKYCVEKQIHTNQY